MINDIKKEIEKRFALAYSSSQIEDFRQLDKGKVLIVIDDFHRSKVNNKYKPVFITNLVKLYPNILITVNSYFFINEIFIKSDSTSAVYDEFLKFQIIEFGHILRNRLIQKWVTLGSFSKLDVLEQQRKVYTCEKTIDTIVGKNFIPAYPIFILTILQAIEAGTPIGSQASQYGYYYQYLISQALVKTIQNDEIDFYDNYLAEYAYFLFDNDLRELTSSEIKRFHDYYCTKYSVDKNLEKILDNLIKTELFTFSEGMYWIRYTYIFYYFVAKYLANNLSNTKIKEKVRAMSLRIYREEFANIILFITHLSRDQFILNLLISNAKELFKEIAPIRFEQDTNALNSLLEGLPKEVLENKTSEEVHDSALKLRDDLELSEKDYFDFERNQISPLKECLNEDISLIDIISKLNYAFKTIEILGQIGKKYYASIDGDLKYELASETYFLGLRGINLFLSDLEADPMGLIDELSRQIENKDVNPEKLKRMTTDLVLGVSMIVSYGFIEKVAISIGSEHLAQTFDRILRQNETNAIRLIDIAIKLDYYTGSPISYIRDILPSLKRNYLAYILLRQFVIRYLYMFKIGYEQKAQICSLLDIKMETQFEIEYKSKDVKKLN